MTPIGTGLRMLRRSGNQSLYGESGSSAGWVTGPLTDGSFSRISMTSWPGYSVVRMSTRP